MQHSKSHIKTIVLFGILLLPYNLLSQDIETNHWYMLCNTDITTYYNFKQSGNYTFDGEALKINYKLISIINLILNYINTFFF